LTMGIRFNATDTTEVATSISVLVTNFERIYMVAV
jgi:hypothetical protein